MRSPPFGAIAFLTLALTIAFLTHKKEALAGSLRKIFLNGIDISSAKSQELQNVNISINEYGDIFISAPHYQVHEEDHFVPLSKYMQTENRLLHTPPQGLSRDTKASVPTLNPKSETLPKEMPGEPETPASPNQNLDQASNLEQK